ncbi:MAG: hypothetical protein PHR14_07295 [Oscillospiraceae bacterium]|nr:hypothetical protein [Oscillospiraceae bacterium]
MKQSGKVALGGILGALSLTFMMLTFFSLGTYALPAIAGAVLIPFVVEVGAKSAWMVYGSVALLSLLIAPDIEAKVLFINFFGYYPILKSLLERTSKRWLEWILKLLVFNTSIILSFLLLIFVFNLEFEMLVIGGVNLVYIMLAFGNIVFVIYDFALTNVISMYMRVLHPRIKKIFKLDK